MVRGERIERAVAQPDVGAVDLRRLVTVRGKRRPQRPDPGLRVRLAASLETNFGTELGSGSACGLTDRVARVELLQCLDQKFARERVLTARNRDLDCCLRAAVQLRRPPGTRACAARNSPIRLLDARKVIGVMHPSESIKYTFDNPGTYRYDCSLYPRNIHGYDGGNWFIVGGTSVSSPTFAGVVAIADQLNGAPLGFLNPALYKIDSDPARYSNDFFDVMTGNNDQFQSPKDPNYAASAGWDPVTGLGTPNAANLVPDLILAVHGK
jgi:hypothetical protein